MKEASEIYEDLTGEITPDVILDESKVYLYESPPHGRWSKNPCICQCRERRGLRQLSQKDPEIYIIELESKNQELNEKLKVLQHQILFLSRQGIKYGKKMLQLEQQAANKDGQIETLRKKLEERNQKYIIIEGEFSGEERKDQANRKGKNWESNLKDQKLEDIIKEVNNEKPTPEKVRSIDEEIQRHLIKFVVENNQTEMDKQTDLSELLADEKNRIMEYVKNFDVMIGKQESNKGKWAPLKLITNLFKYS